MLHSATVAVHLVSLQYLVLLPAFVLTYQRNESVFPYEAFFLGLAALIQVVMALWLIILMCRRLRRQASSAATLSWLALGVVSPFVFYLAFDTIAL